MTAEQRPDDAPVSGDSPWPEWVQVWVLPYLQEEALWPVLVALLGHVVVAIAPVILYCVRDGNPGSLAVLFLLVAVTGYPVVFELQHVKRPGAVSLVVALTWVCSGLIAWGAGSYGLL